MKIKSPRYWLQPKGLINFIILFSCICQCLIFDFHFPSIITYILDLCLILTMLHMTRGVRSIRNITELKMINTCIFGYLIAIVVSDIVHPPNLLPWIWQIRYMLRGIVFFYACIIYLDSNDVDDIFNKMVVLQYINAVVVVYQFLALNLRGDNLGGIFGHGGGPGINIFQAIVVTVCLVRYLNKKISLIKYLSVAMLGIVISALAEEKFFYIAFLISTVIVIMITRFTFKKFLIILTSIFILFVGINVLNTYFPNSLDVFLDKDIRDLYLSGTSGGYELGRFGSFERINSMLFNSDLLNILFGKGFGNCTATTISSFVSTFYQQYGYLNYNYFVHQMVYLETGLSGFIIYLLFFVISFLQGVVLYINSMEEWQRYILCIFCAIMPVIILSIWYNSSLITYCYLNFFLFR